MRNSKRLHRFGVCAIGLGFGAAMASVPVVASADSTPGGVVAEAAAAILPDLGNVAAAAAAVTPATLPDSLLNYSVSISGFSLIDLGTANASSSFGNVAIAYGDYADSNAMSGFFNYATATGDHSHAVVGVTGLYNYASATGLWSYAGAGWGSGNTAVANGDHAVAQAGAGDGTAIYDSNFNTATSEGYQAIARAGWDGSSSNVANAVGNNIEVNDPGPSSGAATDGWLSDFLSSLNGGSTVDSDDWFAGLLSALDGSSAAGEGGNWFTGLLSLFDPGSAAADGADFWTELATLF